MHDDDGSCNRRELTPEALSLFDKSDDIVFDDLTELTKEICLSPVALISIIDYENDRQVFASQNGLCAPYSEERETPLSHSFCRLVLELDAPLNVGNSSLHPLVQSNPAITDLNVVAYLGVPIYGADDTPIGALCAIDHETRRWSDTQVRRLQALARCVSTRVALRAEVLIGRRRNAELKRRNAEIIRYNAVREAVTVAIVSPDLPIAERFRAILKSGCDALGMERAAIEKYDTDQASIVFAHGPKTARLEGTRRNLSGSLSGLIMQDPVAQTFHDVAHSPCKRRVDFAGLHPKSYLSAPLVLGDITYGVIEFSSDAPRDRAWSEDDLSILSLISVLVASYLTLFDENDRLRNSELALVRYVGELRARDRAPERCVLPGMAVHN